MSRESGEITDDEEIQSVKDKPEQEQLPDTIPDDDYNRFSCYVARSWAERVIMDNLPAPKLSRDIRSPPDPKATLITDRVGSRLTRLDRVLVMQNNVASDFWDLARKLSNGQVRAKFRYIFVQIGLDWCLDVKKTMIKEGMKRLLYGVNKITGGCAVVGILGITPNYPTYSSTKVNAVTFNRCLQQAVKECQDRWKVEYIPMHLHFLDSDGGLVQPLQRYFNTTTSEYTLAGGFVLRQYLLKAIGVIPMDGNH